MLLARALPATKIPASTCCLNLFPPPYAKYRAQGGRIQYLAQIAPGQSSFYERSTPITHRDGHRVAGLDREGQRRRSSPAAEHPADAEKKAGWKLLFDGKTTTGWRGYKMDKTPPGWSVLDGVLVCVKGGEGGKGAGGGDDIVTTEEFQNFDLQLEWKTVPSGNSGVLYHVSEEPVTAWHYAPEVQILDNTAHPTRDPRQLAGACYDLYASSKDMTKPLAQGPSEIRHIQERTNRTARSHRPPRIPKHQDSRAGGAWRQHRPLDRASRPSVSRLKLYPSYREKDFAAHSFYPLDMTAK